ncbi:hypothetical protein D3C77_518660 [compost metagenome]
MKYLRRRLLKDGARLHLFAFASYRINGNRLFLRSLRKINFDARPFLWHAVEDVVAFRRVREPPISSFVWVMVNVQMHLNHIVTAFHNASFKGNSLDGTIRSYLTTKRCALYEYIFIID